MCTKHSQAAKGGSGPDSDLDNRAVVVPIVAGEFTFLTFPFTLVAVGTRATPNNLWTTPSPFRASLTACVKDSQKDAAVSAASGKSWLYLLGWARKTPPARRVCAAENTPLLLVPQVPGIDLAGDGGKEPMLFPRSEQA